MSIRIWPGEDCPLGWGLFDDDDDSIISVVMVDDMNQVLGDDCAAGEVAWPVLRAIQVAAIATAHHCHTETTCVACYGLGFNLARRKDRVYVDYCRCRKDIRKRAETKAFAEDLFADAMRALTGE